MSIISRYVYQTAKYALLLCMFCCLLGGNWAHASKVILFSGYDENFGGMPGVTTVVEGELDSIKGVDNYQSQSGVVRAYSMDVSFYVVQDVPGFGKFTNKAYDSSIYFYMNSNGNLKAESNSSIEANILSSDTFLSRLNLLLETSYPEVYQQLKAELESNTVPVATNKNSPEYSADGVMIEVPTTLPTDSSKEIYDLQKTKEVLIYKANNELYEGAFMLTCEDPMVTYRAVIPVSAREQNTNLPAMWYKITDMRYPESWEAFTYDKTTGVFSFYTDYENKIINFANYWFIDINHLESRRTDKSMPIGVDAVFKRLSGGDYWTDQTFVSPTITDAMLCFLHYVKK